MVILLGNGEKNIHFHFPPRSLPRIFPNNFRFAYLASGIWFAGNHCLWDIEIKVILKRNADIA